MVNQVFNAKNHPDEKAIKPFLEKIIAANNSLANISKQNEADLLKIKELYEQLRQQQNTDKFNQTLLSSIAPSESVDPYSSNGITTVAEFLAWKPKKRTTTYSPRYGQIAVAIDKLKANLEKNEAVSIDAHATDPTSISLVQKLTIVIQTRIIVEDAKSLYDQHHDSISTLVKGVKELFTGLPWFLKKSSKKEEIWHAIVDLQNFEDKTSILEHANRLQTEYTSTVKEIEKNAGILTEFAKNTAPYYALLDRIIERSHSQEEELGFDIDEEMDESPSKNILETLEKPSTDFSSKKNEREILPNGKTSRELHSIPISHDNTETAISYKDSATSESTANEDETDKNPYEYILSKYSEVSDDDEDDASSDTSDDNIIDKPFDRGVPYHPAKKQQTYTQQKPKRTPVISPQPRQEVTESWEERELKTLTLNAKELTEKVKSVSLNTSKLTAILRPYQEFAVKYILLQKKVLLGDEMGLGKTVEAIAAMTHLAATFKERLYFLVICPLSILENWGREVRKHSTLKPYQIQGKDANAVLNIWKKNGGVGITTYETIKKIDVSSIDISLLVVDEAHYIKNPESARTKRVLEVQEMIPRVVYMTGTPLENRLKEMTFLISNLQPDICIPQYWYKELPDEKRFRLKVIPVYLRRVRNDVLKELKEKVEIEDWGAMNDIEQQHYYHALQYDTYMAIRRHSWSLSDLNKSFKAQKLLEICDDAKENGRKVLVFTYFKDTLQKVCTLLGNRCYGPIDGSVPGPDRQGIIDRFSDGPAGSVLACQIISGGMGLNIQAASVVIICEPQLKPSTENQAISRAYRVGQAENVFVHRLLLSDTIDEHLMGILQGKTNLFNKYADKSLMGVESLKDKQIMGAVLQEELKRHNLRRSEMAES